MPRAATPTGDRKTDPEPGETVKSDDASPIRPRQPDAPAGAPTPPAELARLRSLADALPQIVWITDGAGRLIFHNARWVDYIGAPDGPTTVWEVTERSVHPEDRTRTLAAFESARESGTIFEVEHRILGRDGRYRWFLVRAVPERDPISGEITAWFGSSTDIHDRRLVEDALAASEQRLRLIVENARSYAIFTTDEDGRITDWWGGAEEIFGWSRADILGRDGSVLYTPEDVAAGVPAAEFETARNTGSAPDVRWHLRRDGSRVFIDGNVIALRDEAGHLRGFLKIGQDRTEARAIAAALEASEARFRAFAESSSDCLWIRSGDGARFDFVSGACESVLGMDCNTLLEADGGQRMLDSIDGEDIDGYRRHLARVMRGERSLFEFRIRRAGDGEPRWLQDTCFPLQEDTRIRGLGGITKDITRERETRERLRILVAELQHRTRNLLAVVQAVAERTLAGSASLEDFRDRFYPRLTALARVNELLARLDVDSRVTFDQLVRAELSAHAALEAGPDGGRITMSGPSGIRLRSSTIQTLALALHELCTNALKYGALAHPDGRIALRWHEEADASGGRRLHFTWEERGLPPAATAATDGLARRGFGRELIERALPRQLRTEVRYTIDAEGVRCTISLPLSESRPPG
jgi:PAS domain S-box-containing protein